MYKITGKGIELTSPTHADTKAFPVSAMFALRACRERYGTVAGLATRKLNVVVCVPQKKRLK